MLLNFNHMTISTFLAASRYACDFAKNLEIAGSYDKRQNAEIAENSDSAGNRKCNNYYIIRIINSGRSQ